MDQYFFFSFFFADAPCVKCTHASLKNPHGHSCGAFLSSGLFRPETGPPPLRTDQSPGRNARRSLPGAALVTWVRSAQSRRGDWRFCRYILQLGDELPRTEPSEHPCRHPVPGLRLATAGCESRRAHSPNANGGGAVNQGSRRRCRTRRDYHRRMRDRFARAVEAICGEARAMAISNARFHVRGFSQPTENTRDAALGKSTQDDPNGGRQAGRKIDLPSVRRHLTYR
jgi:hypothetical protein